MKFNSLLLLLLFALPLSSLATTIPVSSASDIASASPSPGDTLLMDKNANWSNQSIELDFNGTENAPIVLLADGSGDVVLSGASDLQMTGSYIIVSGLSFVGCVPPGNADLVRFRASSSDVATHCRLTNCFFDNNNPTTIETGYKWVSLYGQYNRVDHCWFQRKEHRGTTLVVWLKVTDDPNYHQIDHNYFTRPEYTSGNNEAETIRIGDSNTSLVNSNTIVEYNFFEACDGEIESISNKSCYNIYRYNTFFDNSSILTLRHGHYCTVEGNFFFGNNKSGSGGVRLIGAGHTVINNYFQDIAGTGNLRAPIVMMGGVDGFGINDATNRYVATQDATVAFNTLVNCEQNIYIGSDKSSSSESYDAPFDCTIDNNIIYNGGRDAVAYEYSTINSFSFSGNIYHNTDLGPSNSGFTQVNPQLSSPGTQTPARLEAGSPAIDAATGNYNLNEDMDGQARTGSYDVGADEYSTDAVVRSPIQKTEVGPCWMSSGACEVLQEDCNGDVGGSAYYDDCDVCVGGNTGKTENTSCQQDCAGEWGGTAEEDQCGVCSGGNTGIEVDACLACDPVVATSSDANLPANAIDGNLTTRWSAQGVGEHIEFCLGDTMLLNSVDIAFYRGNERTTTFDLLASTDGINWTPILSDEVSSGLSTDLETFSFPTTEAWKLRIVGKGNSMNDWNSLLEVEWSGVITGESTKDFSSLAIFPNPCKNLLQVKGVNSGEQITLQNTAGQLVPTTIDFTSNGALLDMNLLQPGVYFLQVKSWNEQHTFQVVKQ